MRKSIFYCSFLLVFFSLVGCHVNKGTTRRENTFEAVNFYNLGPDIFATDFYDFKIDSLTAIKIDSHVVYFLAPIISKRGDELIYDSSRARRVFIYNLKEEYGYFYDSLNSTYLTRQPVDSFLSRYTPMYRNPFLKSDSLVGSTRLSSQVKMEKYVPKVKIENNYDTFFVTFDDRLKTSYFSLSKIADSQRKMKLSKLAYLTKLHDQREIWYYWEIKENVIVDRKVLLDFIRKHEKNPVVADR